MTYNAAPRIKCYHMARGGSPMGDGNQRRTVRFGDRDCDVTSELEERARRLGVSVNQLMVDYCKRGLDNDDRNERRRRRGR